VKTPVDKLRDRERESKQRLRQALEAKNRDIEVAARLVSSQDWDQFVRVRENDVAEVVDRMLALKDPSPYEIGMLLGELRERDRLRNLKQRVRDRLDHARQQLREVP